MHNKNLSHSFYCFFFLIVYAFCSCNNGPMHPDVSNVKINLSLYRFEQDLFDAGSNNKSLNQVKEKYKFFYPFFNNTVLGLQGAPPDTADKFVRLFVKDFMPIKDSASLVFANFNEVESSVKKALQHIKYYFPNYKTPEKLITYIGPLDGYGDVLLTNEGIMAVGLQLHLGKNFSAYKAAQIREVYPEYISARFEPDYIAVNCAKNILNDIYPVEENDQPLFYQMVDNGKRLYLLSRMLPDEEEHKLIGYTKEQMKDCYKQEATIWQFFLKSGYLQMTDKNSVKSYLSEGPKTQELGNDAPGNIGSFSGWQIVKRYMQKHAELSLIQLMQLDNDVIFQEVKYKP